MNGEKKMIKMSDGIHIHAEIHESTKDRWLLVTHGIGEHLGRHKNYILDLFSSTHNIAFYDLRGHGISEGKKAWIDDFKVFYHDLSSVVEYLKKEYRLEKLSLFGHSMGGLITAGYIQQGQFLVKPDKVFLNAPPAGIPGFLGKLVNLVKTPWLKKLSEKQDGVYLKGLVDLKQLSHDQTVRENYISDDLCQLSLNTSLLLQMIKESREVFSKPFNFNGEIFCSVGSADKIVSAQSLVEYFSFIDKSVRFKLIEGSFHEIHNEINNYRDPYFEFLKTSLQ